MISSAGNREARELDAAIRGSTTNSIVPVDVVGF